MSIFASPRLEVEKYRGDPDTYELALVVDKYAEWRRAEYRSSEKPMKGGLLGGIDGSGLSYWSDGISWGQWMAEPNVLMACAIEYGAEPEVLADLIFTKFHPENAMVFLWMAEAFKAWKVSAGANERLEAIQRGIDADMNRKKAAATLAAREKGRRSGQARRSAAKATPDAVKLAADRLLANGTAERDIAGKLANKFGVTSDYIRRLRKK